MAPKVNYSAMLWNDQEESTDDTARPGSIILEDIICETAIKNTTPAIKLQIPPKDK